MPLRSLSLLAIVHFPFVVLSALEFRSHPQFLNPVLEPLLHCTGGNNGYKFFAPDVASELRCQLSYFDRDNTCHTHEFGEEFSGEVRSRSLTSLSFLVVSPPPETKRQIIASWAAWYWRLHPDAHRCEMRVFENQLPSMAEFHAGRRPEWILAGVGSFHQSDFQGVQK